MNPGVVGLITFACTFGGALVGMWLRRTLPQHHLDGDSRDTVKVGIGLIATMTALVLGLVTASAKSTFDGVDAAVKETATTLRALDRVLARYGPETQEVRRELREAIGARIDAVWPRDSSRRGDLDPLRSGALRKAEGIAATIEGLRPRDAFQQALQSRARDLVETLLQARWVALADHATSVPGPFLVILLFWLAITFASFGLFAPRNVTVVAVLFVCAVSVASAVFLVLEMDGPFDGLLKVSAEPLRRAHAHLGQ
jgi:hypothetical protein